jgi:hypothetical protein
MIRSWMIMILNAEVDAPMQNNLYSDTYYQIDKFNQIEAQYVLGNKETRSTTGHPSCCSDSSI